MPHERVTEWDELDYADEVVVTYQHVRDAGAEPELDHWAELMIDDVDWTAAWIDRAVAEATYEPGKTGPAFILWRHKTAFSWGADAAHLEIVVWVADHLFSFTLGVGLPMLAKKVNERLRGETPVTLTLDEAVRRARSRVAVRTDLDVEMLVVVSTIEREHEFEVVLRAPDGATYTVLVAAVGPHTQRVEVHRTYHD